MILLRNVIAPSIISGQRQGVIGNPGDYATSNQNFQTILQNVRVLCIRVKYPSILTGMYFIVDSMNHYAFFTSTVQV